MIPRLFPTARIGSAALGLVLAGALAACSIGASPTPEPTPEPTPVPSAAASGDCPTEQPETLPAGTTKTVTIQTDLGAIELELDSDLSPIAVANFVALAGCGFYDGVVFHRIVPGFVIQGGDGQYGRADAYEGSLVGTGGPGYQIQDEPVTTTYGRGTVAMARSSLPNSVGSQFFIVLADDAAQALGAPQYNNYQIIGEVTAGMEIADAIAAAANGVEIPQNAVVMSDVSVSDGGA